MSPDRRKSPEEYREEIAERAEADGEPLPDPNPDGGTPDDPEAGTFVPFTEQERVEANAAFNLLIDNGYITVGPYELSSDAEGRKVVTVSAFLPSSLEGRQAGDTGGGDDGGGGSTATPDATPDLPIPEDGEG